MTKSLMGDPAVTAALGCSSANGPLASSYMRDALKKGNYAPFDHTHWTFGATLTILAASILSSHFQGHRLSTLISPLNVENHPHRGFVRAGSRELLFHPDSDDYEVEVEALRRQGHQAYQRALNDGVNGSQALELLSMSHPVNVVISGSAMDFHALRKAFPRQSGHAHPDLVELGEECWREITAAYPLTAQAIDEVFP